MHRSRVETISRSSFGMCCSTVSENRKTPQVVSDPHFDERPVTGEHSRPRVDQDADHTEFAVVAGMVLQVDVFVDCKSQVQLATRYKHVPAAHCSP
jgi:hypothetical protein